MIFSSADQLILDDVFINLHRFAGELDVILKIEGYNPAGSIKMKTAVGLVEHAENHQGLQRGGHLIESSSGNLGVALSVVSATRGYRFTCVTDPNALPGNVATMRSFGADVVEITKRDINGGYLASRLDYINERLRREPDLVWMNQYANSANKRIHRERTAAAILKEFPHVDYLFVGAGTTGTLMGCAERFRVESPSTIIVAVDVHGSVTFGGPAMPRHIPGLGTSRRPELFQPEYVDQLLLVDELESIGVCRRIAVCYGILVGGSTGAVLSGVNQLAGQMAPQSVIIAISPDNGDRYVDRLYSDDWVSRVYGHAPAAGRLHDNEQRPQADRR